MSPRKKPEVVNLATTWIRREAARDIGLTEAVGYMNQATGRQHGTNRVYEWMEGKRTPDGTAINYMVERVIEGELEAILDAALRLNPSGPGHFQFEAHMQAIKRNPNFLRYVNDAKKRLRVPGAKVVSGSRASAHSRAAR